MNDNSPDNDNILDPMPSVVPPVIPPPVRPRRRWWPYALVGLGSALAMIALLVAGVAGYRRSLVRNYTSTAPQPLPRAEASSEALQTLFFRAADFYTAVQNGLVAAPLKFSADDLNLLLAHVPQLKDHVRLAITNNRLFGQFTIPLDKARQKELKGRFLNGLARLAVSLDDGRLNVQVLEMKANGRPVPRWILRKVRQENLARDLTRKPDTVAFLRKLARVEVDGDHLVLAPLEKN